MTIHDEEVRKETVEVRYNASPHMVSKAQIDRLGDRLREGDITEGDLQMLDEYRRSFFAAYELVVTAIRDELQLEPTGRPAKSTTAIVEKLVRESIRLSQVQDIAGCRLVVSDVTDQAETVHSLCRLFPKSKVVDRLKNPSHGYRAVHVIVGNQDRRVEIQVRTSLQHMWAELSEKMADVFAEPLIKYGGGDLAIAEPHQRFSEVIADAEVKELQMQVADMALKAASTRRDTLSETKRGELDTFRKELRDWQDKLDFHKQEIRDALGTLIRALDSYRG